MALQGEAEGKLAGKISQILKGIKKSSFFSSRCERKNLDNQEKKSVADKEFQVTEEFLFSHRFFFLLLEMWET